MQSFEQKILSGNGLMSLEDFRLLDIELLDNSITKREFNKIYHRRGDQLNQSDQNIGFFLVKTTIIIKSVMLF